METEVLKEQHYVEELVEIIRSGLPKEELTGYPIIMITISRMPSQS